MKNEIQTTTEDSFSLVNSNDNIENSEIETKSEVVENQENTLGAAIKVPRPAPIENNSGTGWFTGTSWG